MLCPNKNIQVCNAVLSGQVISQNLKVNLQLKEIGLYKRVTVAVAFIFQFSSLEDA